MRLAVDPGLRWCGVAIGDEKTRTLVKAALVMNPDKTGRGPATHAAMAYAVFGFWKQYGPIWDLHIEMPRYYPRQRYVQQEQDVDPNDLIELAGVVGAVSRDFTPACIRHYYPSDWKGQVPKKIMTERIRKKLTAPELDNMITAGAKDHNTLDAIGIFLHSCGRL